MQILKLLILLYLIIPITAEVPISTADEAISPAQYAQMTLRREGFSTDFIQLVSSKNDEDERDRVIQLNVLGFLSRADYTGHYSKYAVKKCREFMRKYKHELRSAEKLHAVPKEIVSALLWVETKHGKQTGNFHVASVLYYLLQAKHPEIIKKTIQNMESRIGAGEDLNKARNMVIERSKLKANWALTELKSLEKMYHKRTKNIHSLLGSHSGAFGVPQFIPSSYLEWARPRTKKRHPDLFNMKDAIYSVAYYLKLNGWKTKDAKAERDALFHYNRSEGYVNIIRKLANELETH